jgi:DNA-directed RNA polymerase subunit RPC12/RpoP
VTCVTYPRPVKPIGNPAEPDHVGTELDRTGTAARCPSCSAALRADAQWCSLCHHDLRPAPVPVAIPSPTPPPYAGQAPLTAPDPLTSPLLDLVLPPLPSAQLSAVPEDLPAAAAPVAAGAAVSWPCTRCGATNALTADVCKDCGSGFLAAVSEPPSLVVPGIGDLQQYSRGHRAALALGLVALILVPLALITFLLTGEPPKNGTSGTDTTVTTVSP